MFAAWRRLCQSLYRHSTRVRRFQRSGGVVGCSRVSLPAQILLQKRRFREALREIDCVRPNEAPS